MSLLVGVLFLYPGILMSTRLIIQLLFKNKSVDYSVLLITIFPLLIGIFLISLAVKLLRSDIDSQIITTPLLFIAGLFFLGMGVFITMETFILRNAPINLTAYIAMGGSYGIGIAVMRAVYQMKKRKIASKNVSGSAREERKGK